MRSAYRVALERLGRGLVRQVVGGRLLEVLARGQVVCEEPADGPQGFRLLGEAGEPLVEELLLLDDLQRAGDLLCRAFREQRDGLLEALSVQTDFDPPVDLVGDGSQ